MLNEEIVTGDIVTFTDVPDIPLTVRSLTTNSFTRTWFNVDKKVFLVLSCYRKNIYLVNDVTPTEFYFMSVFSEGDACTRLVRPKNVKKFNS